MKTSIAFIAFAASLCADTPRAGGSRAMCSDLEITANPEYAIVWFRWPECSPCGRTLDASGLIMHSSAAREADSEVKFAQMPWRTVGVFRSSTELMDYASQLSLTQIYFVEHMVPPDGSGMCEGEIRDLGFVIDSIPRKEGAGHLLESVCVDDELPRSYKVCVPPQGYSGVDSFVFVVPWSWQWVPNTYSESDSYVHILYGDYQGSGLDRNESCKGVIKFELPCQ